MERWLQQGIKGKEVEALEASTKGGRTAPDFRVRGELTEIKTRGKPLSERYIADQIYKANDQMARSGLDADRPMMGMGGRGPQANLKSNWRAKPRALVHSKRERQVRGAFTHERGTSFRRVAVYSDGRLLGEWSRTAVNAIVRSFPAR